MVFLSAGTYCPHYAPTPRASQALRLASLATAKAEGRRRRAARSGDGQARQQLDHVGLGRHLEFNP
jgi:hypothetical protein